jgi:uncharacterized protein
MTTDQQAAQGFYSGLFGWSGNAIPMPEGSYTMQVHGDHRVAGMASMPAGATHSAWNCYIAVEDINASIAAVKANNGEVMMGPHEVSGEGTMAMCIDPTGAAFAMWQPASADSEPKRGFGMMCWHELLTNDFDKAKHFYEATFGWSSETKDMGHPYNLFNTAGGACAGGMMSIMPSMGPIPSNWLVYFDVESIENTLKTASDLGGQVVMGPMDIPGMGKCGVICDPQGAAFGVWQATGACCG